MIEINLVPDIKQALLKAQRIRSTVITGAIMVGVISIAIVALLAFYIYAVQAARGIFADGAIKTGSEKLANVADLSKTLTIQNQLTKMADLNANKKINSRIFDLLNVIIPPSPNEVKISDLTIDSSANLVTINGQASNSYAAVEVFKKTIEAAKVRYVDSDSKTQNKVLASSISTSNTSYGEDSSGLKVLRFTISFVYAEELFSPEFKNVSVIVTASGNATDSYLGVPKSFFADRPADLKEGN
jgi:Tfp pilus assembly protein PilN